MKFEVGKRYRNTENDVLEVVGIWKKSSYPVRCKLISGHEDCYAADDDGVIGFTTEGYYFIGNPDEPRNLVAEVMPVAEAQSATEPSSLLKPAVGKTYRTRGGNTVKFIRKREGGTRLPFLAELESGEYMHYTEDGQAPGAGDDYDLVAEIVTQAPPGTPMFDGPVADADAAAHDAADLSSQIRDGVTAAHKLEMRPGGLLSVAGPDPEISLYDRLLVAAIRSGRTGHDAAEQARIAFDLRNAFVTGCGAK